MEETYVFICGIAGQNHGRYFAKNMQREMDKAACFIYLQSGKKFIIFMMMQRWMDSSECLRLKFATQQYLARKIADPSKRVVVCPFPPSSIAFPQKVSDLYVACSFLKSLSLRRILSQGGNFTIHRIRVKSRPLDFIKKLLTAKPAYY